MQKLWGVGANRSGNEDVVMKDRYRDGGAEVLALLLSEHASDRPRKPVLSRSTEWLRLPPLSPQEFVAGASVSSLVVRPILIGLFKRHGWS